MDQFIAHTGAIKEKLAELARTVSIDPIHGEVFVLFRALMLRFSPIHLIGFWPMIVSEIQILFSQILEQSGVVSKEQLPLFFEACKVLDMMLVVGSEDFQLCCHLKSVLILSGKSGYSSRTLLKQYIDLPTVVPRL
jgi:protein dopey